MVLDLCELVEKEQAFFLYGWPFFENKFYGAGRIFIDNFLCFHFLAACKILHYRVCRQGECKTIGGI